ncbi:MAG: hypothetical protein U1D55_09570 [Phycisphaerae bacterium]
MSDQVAPDKLIAYAAGELPANETSQVEAAVQCSPELARQVEATRRLISLMRCDDSVSPPAATIARAKAVFQPKPTAMPEWFSTLGRVVASLIFDSRMQPALAGFRGDQDGFSLSFQADRAEIDLQVEPATGSEPPGTWNVTGQVSDLSAHAVELAWAWSDEGTLVRAVQSDSHGAFAFQTLPGTYDLLVKLEDRVLVASRVEIT